MDSELLLYLRLANLQLPARITNALLDELGEVEEVFRAPVSRLERVTGVSNGTTSRVHDPTYIPTKDQIDYLDRHRVALVCRQSREYPANLRGMEDAPTVLFVRGRLDDRDRYSVALVGSRRSTPYGRAVTARMARDLSRAGVTVVSGGALGIDTAAHEATVESRGRTIAVLGCGVDIEYPKDNQYLFDRIVENDQGTIMSEYPLGAKPEPFRFPQRNRIISGLALGVVVIEAGDHSGALLTAGIAGEQGRDVMAVPGNVDRESAIGTNQLIRDGAVLVTCAEDVLNTLGLLRLTSPEETKQRPAPPSSSLPEVQRRLLEQLSLQPRHVDALAADLQIAISEVGVQLTLMEMAALVKRLPGNCFVRVL